MAERQLQQILSQLKSQSSTLSYTDAAPLLSKAKLQLLKLNALSPSPATINGTQQQPPQSVLALARETYEQGALYSIRARDPEAFTRYVAQLAPFYELPASVLPPSLAERNRVTGLYLLLLLTQGRYAEFHSELESLAAREGGGATADVEGDRFLGYPIRLERWLMEGSYDRVWKAMKSREVPSEEFAVFSEVSRDYMTMCLCLHEKCIGSFVSADNTISFYHHHRHHSANTRSLNETDPHLPNPQRDRLQQRARLPVPANLLHKVAPLPRL